MTDAQLQTLATHIRANTDPSVVAALEVRSDVELARLYNLPSTFVVWRTSVPVEEYRNAMTWTEVDALTVGKARIWEWITARMTMPVDASKSAVRQGLADCWASNTTTRASLLAVSKRFATVCEKIFATGTGTDATPGTLGWEGTVSHPTISEALNKF